MIMNKTKKRSGGFIVSDGFTILLGRTNKEGIIYECFGGGAEEQDLSSLHTAVRELIEELFNLKLSVEIINSLSDLLIMNKIIKDKLVFYGDSFLIDYKGLEFVFNYLAKYITKYNKYIKPFNLNLFVQERIITDKPSKGLNEIISVHILYLADVINNKYPIRWYSNKVIQYFFNKKIFI